MKHIRIVRAVARLLVFVSIISMVSLFSGCATVKTVITQISTDIADRAAFNQEIAETLKKSGLITSEQYTEIEDRIKQLEDLNDTIKTAEDTANFFDKMQANDVNIFNALTAFRVLYTAYSENNDAAYAESICEINANDNKNDLEEYTTAIVSTALAIKKGITDGDTGAADQFRTAHTSFGTLLGVGAGWASFPITDDPLKEYYTLGENEDYTTNLNLTGSAEINKELQKTVDDILEGKWVPIDQNYIGNKPCNTDVSSAKQLWFNDQVRGGEWNSSKEVTISSNNVPNITPIEIVSKEITSSVQKKLDYEIYVLKSDLDTMTEDFETVFKNIKEWANNAEMDPETGDKYFNSSGRTLGEFFGGIDDLVRETEPFDGDIDSNTEVTGKDLVIYQKAGNAGETREPIATIRLKEFNKEACDAANRMSGILDNDGQGNTRYKIDSKNERVYLMEYPVYAISGIKQDGDKYSATFSESGIGINILSNESCMKKYDYSTESNRYMLSGEYITPVGDSYIVSKLTNISTSSIDSKSSSFVILGSEKLNEEINNQGVEFKIPRIILIDYLEATYAPGFAADSSNLAVFGRKIRFLSLKKDTSGGVSWSSLDDIVAGYVLPNGDKNGAETTNQIKLKDLCDIDGLKETPESEVKVLGGEERNQEKVKSVSKIAEISELNVVGVNKITCTEMWEPGPREEVAQDTRQRFWIIAVSNSMFNNGLLDTWIRAAESDPDNSIIWWNKYLEANNFDYSVEYKKVHNYLIKSYATQMRRFGEFVLDLDTINKVGDILKAEDDINTVKTIRTILILIGWALVAFSIILVVLWLIDTNTDLGLNLLTKATFGHWVAVKYKDDIPGDVTTNTKYVTGQKVVIRSLIIMAVGMFIIVFNALDLINWLINKFGLIAEEVEKLIRGL